MRTLLSYLLAASMALSLAACVNTVTRGHLKEDEALTNIRVGVTTKETARAELGSPSSESTFGPQSWYYVSSIRQTRGPFAPVVSDQRVIEITFDSGGIVSAVKQYSLKDSKNVETAKRVTPSEGQQLGFFEQIIDNLGRFNKDDTDSGTSNAHTHGNPNPTTGYPGR